MLPVLLVFVRGLVDLITTCNLEKVKTLDIVSISNFEEARIFHLLTLFSPSVNKAEVPQMDEACCELLMRLCN